MKFKKISYFFDFALCPPLVGGLLYAGWLESSSDMRMSAVLSFSAGLLIWTLVEYVVHRQLFHRAPILRPMHAAHHSAPDQYVSSPPGSLPLALILLGYCLFSGFGDAAFYSGAAALLIGYTFYCFVHHATHHVRNPVSGYFVEARRRHMLHHFAAEEMNFGVTTNFWDRAFGTNFEASKLTTFRQGSI